MLFLWFILLPLLCLLLCHCLFIFGCDISALVSECKTLSLESSNSLRKHFPWFHGVADSMTGGDPQCCLSDGYFYIYLPPVFTCLLSVVLMYLLNKKTCYFTFMLLLSLTKNTWPQRASPAVNCVGSALSTCCCWRENYCLCESIPKWQYCSLVCMYTFVIEM